MQEIINEFNNSLIKELEKRVREALELWGVNPDDIEEIKSRCRIVQYEESEHKYVYVDDYMVLKYGEWEMEEVKDEFKVKAKMSISNPIPPKVYGIKSVPKFRVGQTIEWDFPKDHPQPFLAGKTFRAEIAAVCYEDECYGVYVDYAMGQDLIRFNNARLVDDEDNE